MAVKLQLRYDTAANWTSNNPTLLAGEIGIESDTKKMKVGDGTTAWNAPLAYAFVTSGSPAITTSITTTSLSFDLINTTATTVNFAGAATTLSIGATTGTTTINNALKLGTITPGTVTAGQFEFDGYQVTSTPTTNIGRAVIPSTVYTSGTGISLTAVSEATSQNLFPVPNDTITLPIGYYYIKIFFQATRGTTSTTSASARINLLGSGTAAGTFIGTASGYAGTASTTGTPTMYQFMSTNINLDNVVTPAITTVGGSYYSIVSGIMKITTAGTFVPKYSLSANLTSAGTATTPSANNILSIQPIQMGTSSPAATGAWA